MDNIILKHKGYEGKFKFDNEAKIFYGSVINIKDVITFCGDFGDTLKKDFVDSIEDYLAFCKELGEKPEKPKSKVPTPKPPAPEPMEVTTGSDVQVGALFGIVVILYVFVLVLIELKALGII